MKIKNTIQITERIEAYGYNHNKDLKDFEFEDITDDEWF